MGRHGTVRSGLLTARRPTRSRNGSSCASSGLPQQQTRLRGPLTLSHRVLTAPPPHPSLSRRRRHRRTSLVPQRRRQARCLCSPGDGRVSGSWRQSIRCIRWRRLSLQASRHRCGSSRTRSSRWRSCYKWSAQPIPSSLGSAKAALRSEAAGCATRWAWARPPCASACAWPTLRRPERARTGRRHT